MSSRPINTSSRESRIRSWKQTPRPAVTPSLLNCDFSRIAEELNTLVQAMVPAMHLDVMDGHFVPNITYGAPVISDWRGATDAYFDAHLMISDPGRYLDDFVRAGCDTIIFHIEAVPEPLELLRRIRNAGCLASIALNPPTPLEQVIPFLDEVDSVLVMSVMPGFGGQVFDASVLEKLRRLRSLRPSLDLNIDGGINPSTAAEATAAGATQLVAGSAVFKSEGTHAEALARLAEGALRGTTRGFVPANSTGPPSLA